MEIAISAAVIDSVAADNETETWKRGHKHAAAMLYVQRKAKDCECDWVITGIRATPSDEFGDYDSIDVSFIDVDTKREWCMTVWYEPLRNGLYGEW